MRAIDDEKSGIIFLVLLDLSSAFDTIDYFCLFLKELLEVDGHVLKWFTSFLSSQTQEFKTAIHHHLYAVHQGSVLGPILFCIYISHSGKIIRKHGFTFHIYADNTQVYIGFKPEDAVWFLERLRNVLMRLGCGNAN